MNIRRIAVVLLALVLTLGLAATALSCGDDTEEEKVIQVANLAPFSGPYAAWGFMSQISFDIAVEDINADGGVKVGDDYYLIEVIKYDNQMNPTVSTTVTRKAIYDDGIEFLSIISTDEAAAVNQLVNDEEAIMFAMAPYRDYTGTDFPYSFQTYYEIVEGEDVILAYVKERYPNYTRVAAMCPDDVRGRIAGEDFEAAAEAAGFEVVDIVYSGAEQTDFYSVLTPLLSKDIDVINLSATGGSQQGYIIKQARELGYEGLFMHPDTLDIPTVAEIASIDAIEGNLAASQLVEMPTAVGRSWAERYVQRYGSLQYWSSLEYDNLLLLEAAIEKAGTLDTDKVMEALGTVTVEGASGPASFSANPFTEGLARALKVKMYVIQIQNGEQVDVYSGFGGIWD